MLQDPTEHVNFIFQQLDGTSNKWGWCKQKVYHGFDTYVPKPDLHLALFMLISFDVALNLQSLEQMLFLLSLVVYKAGAMRFLFTRSVNIMTII
jgi:hypothetical protein